MTREELRAIMEYLRQKVRLNNPQTSDAVTIAFDAPTADEMASADLNVEGSRRILDAAWWEEMLTDIVETPEMCEPDDSPEQVLEYARDVVSEYIRKRAEL